MKKRTVTLFLMTMICGLMLAVTAYADAPDVTVHGVPVDFGEQPPVIVGNSTLVPIRGVFEALGFEVEWLSLGDTAQITLSREGTTLILITGQQSFTANGVSRPLDEPAQLINGRTMLPIRAVVEAAGYDVGWDGATRSITISIPPLFRTLPTQPRRHITAEELAEWNRAYDYLGGINEFEREVLRLTNIERARYDLPPLVFNDTLARAARFKSQGMSNFGYADHTSPVYGSWHIISDVVFDMGLFGGAMAENIATGQTTPAMVVADWMESPGHRAAILTRSFTEIGVGFYNNRWTQKFR